MDNDCERCGTPGKVVSRTVTLLSDESIDALREKLNMAQQARDSREAKAALRQQASVQQAGWTQASWQQASLQQAASPWASKWQPTSTSCSTPSWDSPRQEDPVDSDTWQDYESYDMRSRSDKPIAMTCEVAVEIPGDGPCVQHIHTSAHRPELCAICKRWGDCRGFFLDPFVVFMVVMLLDPEAHDLQWQEHDGAAELIGSSLGRVRLLPHVHQAAAPRSSCIKTPTPAADATRRRYGMK